MLCSRKKQTSNQRLKAALCWTVVPCRIKVNRPNVIKVYNETMGGVDSIDSAIANYKISVTGKKWWFPHFTNTIMLLYQVNCRKLLGKEKFLVKLLG